MADLKEALHRKKLKQVELGNLINVEPGRVSLFVNGYLQIPKKYHQQLSEILEIPIGEFSKTAKKENVSE